MLTGDNDRTAAAIAAQAGISRVIANVLPEDKLRAVADLQADGRRVAMVGDGVNDAPALVQADVGVAIGSATDVAVEASDLTLLSSELTGVDTALRLARATHTTILQNLGWAFGYNLIALPLAGLGLLNPAVAAAAMGLSSLSVVANSLRLYRFGRPERRPPTEQPLWLRIGAAWAAPAVLFTALVAGPRLFAGSGVRQPSGELQAPTGTVVDWVIDAVKSNHFQLHMYTYDSTRQAVDAQAATALFTPLDQRAAATVIPLYRVGAGHFINTGGSLPGPGPWMVSFDIETPAAKSRTNAQPMRLN
jgi:haloacid dehalogenase-like hydrolase